MKNKVLSLKNPKYLHIIDHTGKTSFGCNQEWYGTDWQRLSGCGPSVVSNIILYMIKSERLNLVYDINHQAGCVKLMEAVWEHVTPTKRGIYATSLLVNGFGDFADKNGCLWEYYSIDIPEAVSQRPDLSDVVEFIGKALKNDCPVAFLNLSNGDIDKLDRWHWVTVISIEKKEDEKIILNIYDGSKSFEIDLRRWYQTTTLGGGFAYFDFVV